MVHCLVQGFDSLLSAGGQPLLNEFDCPLVELRNDVFTTSSDSILKAAHGCSKKVLLCKPWRENGNQLEYHHDWTNRLYCFNVYCIN